MISRALKTLVVTVLAVSAILAMLAYADIFLSDYDEATGTYYKVWAYIEGWAEQDPVTGCLTGRLYGIWGTGGAEQIRPLPPGTDGYWQTHTIVEPDRLRGDRAYQITEAWIYDSREGTWYIDAQAVAWIWAVKGAC